ncbi:MAG: glycosyltransferase family 9 protein [Chitinophagaceae bacterium]|nr:glycosyltransferase family 9 protein [Chitinophagaceae bacterium]
MENALRESGGESAPVHEIERNNALIHHFTHRQACKPALYPTAKDDSAVAQYKINPYITISPASVWFTKQYPAQKWADFMNRVPAVYTLYLLGGREDAGLAEEIREKTLHPSLVNLCGKLDFLQSAALMRDALMNYTNDSAPMHFASAVNAPVTAVYCSTIPAFGYGPLSDKHFIVEKKEPLYCRPCGLHGYRACPQGHFRCAADIRDEQLLETIGLNS